MAEIGHNLTILIVTESAPSLLMLSFSNRHVIAFHCLFVIHVKSRIAGVIAGFRKTL
jgi:hypothetical protein